MSPFEFFYYIGYFLKKRYAIKNQKKLPFKVISIGNITTGGTGKTPMTIAIASEAKKRGFSPIVLTRGYMGKAKGPCFVTPSLKHSITPSLFFGDEPILIAERLKNVPIVKCADRYKGGMFAIQSLQPSAFSLQPIDTKPPLFILDDGFQHWRLYRDLNIVLINGQNPFGNRKMLPSGPLRGPLVELKRANIFVITNIRDGETERQQYGEDIISELRKFNPDAPVYFSEYKMFRVRNVAGSEFSVEALKDKKGHAFCGIANPESFRQMVLPLCEELVGFKSYRDHHHYTKADLLYLVNQSEKHNSDFLITTGKDMVKIRELKIPDNILRLKNWLCLEIDCHVDTAFFDRVLKNIP